MATYPVHGGQKPFAAAKKARPTAAPFRFA